MVQVYIKLNDETTRKALERTSTHKCLVLFSFAGKFHIILVNKIENLPNFGGFISIIWSMTKSFFLVWYLFSLWRMEKSVFFLLFLCFSCSRSSKLESYFHLVYYAPNILFYLSLVFFLSTFHQFIILWRDNKMSCTLKILYFSNAFCLTKSTGILKVNETFQIFKGCWSLEEQ